MNSGDPPHSFIGVLIAIGALILLSMIFSASESAFLSINKLRMRFLRQKRDKRAMRAGKLLDNRQRLLNTLLVGNNIVNIAISALMTAVALKIFGAAGVGYATVAATVLLLIFGEITPKTVGSRHPEPVAFLFSRIVGVAVYILFPIVTLITGITRGIVSLTGIELKEAKVSFTEEDIRNFIDVGEEEGVLESGEKSMMHRVFKFSDLEARAIMVPRTKIQALPSTVSYREAIALSERTRYSRFPVYRDDIDNIIGILYIKDLLFFNGDENEPIGQELLRPPLFVLASKKMSSVQQVLRENRQSIAVVIDEYSGTDGILTTEDITREIFGTISDEYETDARPAFIYEDEGGSLADAHVRLIDINEKFGLNLQSDFYETLSGFLSERFDRIPQAGDVLKESGYIFTVEEADGRKANRVRIARDTAAEIEEES